MVCKICGIVGVFNVNNAPSITLDLVLKQQSRGKDGTGIGFLINKKCLFLKKSVEPSEYEKLFREQISGISSKIAIGHNRAATCNYPEKELDKEAHPFLSEKKDFMLVHNGIIREHIVVRRILRKVNNHSFSSGVDSEILVHILEDFLSKSKDRYEALSKFYELSQGNVIVLFSDGEMIGIPDSSFYLLTRNKQVFLASEADTFKDLVKKDRKKSTIYSPTYSGCMVSIKMKNKVPILKFIGKWVSSILQSGNWIATQKTTCDFCKVSKWVMRFKDSKEKRLVDKCLDCWNKKAELPKVISSLSSVPQRSRANDFYEQMKKAKLVKAQCNKCDCWVTFDLIIVCRDCHRFMCIKCYFDDTHHCNSLQEIKSNYEMYHHLPFWLPMNESIEGILN